MLWDSLPAKERQFYTDFLGSLGYDNTDRYLTVNEFQAYLMQQPLEFAASYFKRFLDRFEGPGANGEADRLSETAQALDSFLQSTFGLRAGETVLPDGREAHGR